MRYPWLSLRGNGQGQVKAKLCIRQSFTLSHQFPLPRQIWVFFRFKILSLIVECKAVVACWRVRGRWLLLKSNMKKERRQKTFIEHLLLPSMSPALFDLILTTTFCGRYNYYLNFANKKPGGTECLSNLLKLIQLKSLCGGSEI